MNAAIIASDLTPEQEALVKSVEKKITALLLMLEESTGHSIDFVWVDPRNWAGLKTEVFLTTTNRR